MVKLNNWQEEYFFYQVVVWSEMLQMDHKNIQAIVAQQLVWLTYSCSNLHLWDPLSVCIRTLCFELYAIELQVI